MIRLDISYFYRLAQAFAEIRRFPENVKNEEVWLPAYQVQLSLRQLFQDDAIKGAIRGSVRLGEELYQALSAIVEADTNEEFSSYQKVSLVNKLESFEAVLTSELSVADSYFVMEKPPFSTVRLISGGEALFSSDISEKVPEAIADLQEAGKCLAFELPTACGFHIMRAMEMVLRRYWEATTGNKPHPKQKNIGVYIRALEDAGCSDQKILSALKQIKDLHRNPILHPDENLSIGEAISLIGIVRGVVDAMLLKIPDMVLKLSPE